MAEFFDIDHPTMKRLYVKQIGEDFPGMHHVSPKWDGGVVYTINAKQDYAPEFQEMVDFAKSPDLPGQMHLEYYDPFVDRAPNGGRMVRYQRIHFYFTDPNSAFAFKMRYG
ncbi:MAG: hypothetical protein EOP83_10765 [Verrucomicrobiaceae bacterium]|nr:MAG: hypothetical protein EOP83_10765 [Verrucomicrobiaceae bacterium]